MIDQIHSQYNARQFETLYKESHPVVRQAQSQSEMVKLMQANYDKYGAFKNCSYSKVNVVMGAPVESRAVYNCSFEKGDATELFSLTRDGDKMELLRYQIYPGTIRPKSE